MDKKPLIGIVICMLFLINVSAVLANPEEEIHLNENTGSFTFVKLFDQYENMPTLYNTISKRETPRENIVGPNLAPNPSFEEGDTMPTGWTFSPNTTGIYHWDSDYAHTGEKSIEVSNLTTTYPFAHLSWISDFIPVNYMNSYAFSGWFKIIGVPAEYQRIFLFILEYDEYYQLHSGGGYLYSYSDSEWHHSLNVTTSYHGSQIKYVKLELGQQCSAGEEGPNPLVEVRFDDIYFGLWNTAPDTPTITGETKGRVRTLYDYTFTTIDADQNDVKYQIDWGDNTTQTTKYYKSGQVVNISHIWGIEGTYSVKVQAVDEYDAESYWTELIVTMPCSHTIPFHSFWDKLFERFPNAFSLLRDLLGYT